MHFPIYNGNKAHLLFAVDDEFLRLRRFFTFVAAQADTIEIYAAVQRSPNSVGEIPRYGVVAAVIIGGACMTPDEASGKVKYLNRE